MLKTDSIKAFLNKFAHADLADSYHAGMEVQVNVAQEGGEKTDGNYRGRKWLAWTDGLTTWKPFRIPYKANTEPEYTDSEMKFDLVKYTEGIGMTGWNWEKRVSEWVAFDFDSIVGHSEKHTAKLKDDDLQEIESKVKHIPWVELRRSTGGRGLHIYVRLKQVPTANHNEHAALARAILGKLSSLAGFDLSSKVDICGGNMWVWHRKLKKAPDGLSLIKKGDLLDQVPLNWRDHIGVVAQRTKKTVPAAMGRGNMKFDTLSSQKNVHSLDNEHIELINYLESSSHIWWWDQDHSMLVTHAYALKEAHKKLGLRGLYDTLSEGKDMDEQNCFAFPKRNGSWTVRRYSMGCSEHACWSQDENGWTYCSYNQKPDFKTAVRFYNGLENEKGHFIFSNGEDAMKAAECFNINLKLSNTVLTRTITLKSRRTDNRLIVNIPKEDRDLPENFRGYVEQPKHWERVYNMSVNNDFEEAIGNYDDLVRHMITPSGDDNGWGIFAQDQWRNEPLQHVKYFLKVSGFSTPEQSAILGSCVARPWTVENVPFADEYPGNRKWNRNSSQLRFAPTENLDNLSYPTWQKLLDHIGEGLTEGIKKNKWCIKNGISTGSEYLKCWIASLFQEPKEPLPYLFFHGPQNSGKSVFHEAIDLLVTSGVISGASAITNTGNFNAEIGSAFLCYIEEIDLNAKNNTSSYNKIKEWVTAKKILFHEKNCTPYQILNTTHWVQMSNDAGSVPIFPGDTRINVIYVEAFPEGKSIPKKFFMKSLEDEAPDFIAEILSLEIPETDDRLNIPTIESDEKDDIAAFNKTPVQSYIEEKCFDCPGMAIPFDALFGEFRKWAEKEKVPLGHWTKRAFGREIDRLNRFPKGRYGKGSNIHYGNISITDPENRIDLVERNTSPLSLGGKNNETLMHESKR